MFNVVFTATAPLVVGWFDRDLDKGYGTRFPLLYREGQKNLYFNLRSIVGWLATAVLHALIILATVMVGADPTEVRGTRSCKRSVLAPVLACSCTATRACRRPLPATLRSCPSLRAADGPPHRQHTQPGPGRRADVLHSHHHRARAAGLGGRPLDAAAPRLLLGISR